MADPVSDPRVTREDLIDAGLEGDRPFLPGTARAALAHRDFRILFVGMFGSQVGTWMQNVLLGAYAFELTHSETYVAVLFWAQLGPMLLLAPLGGLLADSLDRRWLLFWTQAGQLGFSVALGLVALDAHPSRSLVFACVLGVGISNAVGAASVSSVLPTMVPAADLPGAVSLQSAQLNLSRVIGPVIGALMYTQISAASVFLANAGTYVFALVAVVLVSYPRHAADPTAGGLAERYIAGYRVVRADPLVRRIIVTIFLFSFFSLPFLGLLPVIAADNLHVSLRSVDYGVFFALFGVGATAGAVSVGTWFARWPKAKLLRPSLLAFAALLAAFALARDIVAADIVGFALAYAYFVVITSLLTVLQQHVSNAVRGRVMALWFMGFGGTVPLGTLAFGAITSASSITIALLVSAAMSVALVAYADLIRAGAPR